MNKKYIVRLSDEECAVSNVYIRKRHKKKGQVQFVNGPVPFSVPFYLFSNIRNVKNLTSTSSAFKRKVLHMEPENRNKSGDPTGRFDTGRHSKLLSSASDKAHGSIWTKIQLFWLGCKSWLWGYDFFVSYHWLSGGQYAVNLAQRLRERRYEVFLDRAEYAMGDDWKTVGERAIDNTSRLILIATREAVTISQPVEREVTRFTKRDRHVIPIVFEDRFSDLIREEFAVLRQIRDSQLFIEDNLPNLNKGPSDSTVEQLIRSHKVMRRRNVRALLVLIPALDVLAFATWAIISKGQAVSAQIEAKGALAGEMAERRSAETARDVAISEKKKALVELAHVNWVQGFDERKTDRSMVAGLHFLKAARYLEDAGELGRLRSSIHAAISLQDSIGFVIPDIRINGAKNGRNNSQVLTWGSDGYVRLWDTSSKDPVRQWRHEGSVEDAIFNRDETRILTSCADGTVRLWKTDSNTEISVFKHKNVSSAAFNEDESCILTWNSSHHTSTTWQEGTNDPPRNTSDGRARLWDLSTAQNSTGTALLREWDHDSNFSAPLLSRNGSHVVTWDADSVAWFWNVSREQPLRRWQHQGSVSGATFDKNESHVLTWSKAATVRLWRTDSDVALREWNHEASVNGASFDRNESKVLTWSNDGTAGIWDISSGSRTRRWTHDKPIVGAKFNSGETRVLTWSYDGTIRLWDIESDRLIRQFKYDGAVSDAVFNRNSSRVLVWGNSRMARLWDVESEKPIRTWVHEGELSGTAFNADESGVLTWSVDGSARVWNILSERPDNELWNAQSGLSYAVLNKNGHHVLGWGDTGNAQLWDLGSRQKRQIWNHGGDPQCGRLEDFWYINGELQKGRKPTTAIWSRPFQSLSYWNSNLTYSGSELNSDASRVLTWSNDGNAQIWEITLEKPRRVWSSECDIYGATFGNDGEMVLTWSWDGTARIFDVKSQKAIRNWQYDQELDGINHGATFNKGVSRVLTWATDHKSRLWNVVSNPPTLLWESRQNQNGAFFNLNGSKFVAWGDSGAEVWGVLDDNPQLLWKSSEPSDHISINGDATRIVTTSFNEALLWDVTRNERVRVWKSKAIVLGAMFSRDESRVLIWDRDGNVTLHDIGSDDVIRQWNLGPNPVSAAFTNDESSILTWEMRGRARLLDIFIDESMSLDERYLRYEIDSGMTLDSEGRPKILTLEEWNHKRQMVEGG